MNEKNFKITISYDGSKYAGFQRQKELATVQGVLEEALSRIAETDVKIAAAGRTDAGVHALGQVTSAKLNTRHSPDVIHSALNGILPHDIRVLKVELVPVSFHARYSALERDYKYIILNKKWGSPFWEPYAYHVPFSLDVAAMQEGAKYLVGSHDFSSFRAGGHDGQSARCKLIKLSCRLNDVGGITPFTCDNTDSLIIIETKATNYLHSMIRNIVGTLVEVGSGKRIPREIEVILEGKDRRLAGPPAPPQGLYLAHVVYPDL